MKNLINSNLKENTQRTQVGILFLILILFFSCSDNDNHDLTGPDSNTPVPTNTPVPQCRLGPNSEIRITEVPALGSDGKKIKGRVIFESFPHECVPEQFRVMLFISIPGYSPDWICKPYADHMLTSIDNLGFWETTFVTGGRDSEATFFAAFLVSRSFSWSCCFCEVIPEVDGRSVFAYAYASR